MSEEELTNAVARAICSAAYGEGEISEALKLYAGQYLEEAKAALAVARPIIERQERERSAGIVKFMIGDLVTCPLVVAAIREGSNE